MDKSVKRLIKHSRKLNRTIESNHEMIDFLFKRIDEWTELSKDQTKLIDKLFKENTNIKIVAISESLIILMFLIRLVFNMLQ